MLRTMSPPPGIAQLWNVSVFGSKRTIVFGLAPDSLYQSAPFVKTMPSGCDCVPLVDGQSLCSPVARSSRRREPREKSAYQTASSGVSARRRGRDAAFGNAYSLIAMVLESMVAILLTPNSTKTGMPLELITRP